MYAREDKKRSKQIQSGDWCDARGSRIKGECQSANHHRFGERKLHTLNFISTKDRWLLQDACRENIQNII